MRRFLVRLGGFALLGLIIVVIAASVTGHVRFVVTKGVSMEPDHHAGDLVVLEPSSSYHQGDVVAYRGGTNNGLVVLHRIVGGDANGYLIKGDNNQSIDPTKPAADQLIGREVAHIPTIGGLSSSPTVRALLLLLAALTVLRVITRENRSTDVPDAAAL